MNDESVASCSGTSVNKIPSEVGIDPRYECPICLSCLRDPIQTKCGHKFCHPCIFSWLEKKDGCPMECGKLDKVTDLFSDEATKRELKDAMTVCGTCLTEVKLYSLEEHLQIHSTQSKCPLSFLGCSMYVPPEKITEHFDLQINHHMSLLCSKMQELMNSKKDSLEALLWEPEEKHKKQDESQLTNHLKTLFERLVVLEQHSREQEAQIQRLKNELSLSRSNFKELSLRHCLGQHIWQIADFSEKLGKMQSDNTQLYYSDAFYTSPVGYKVCARINLSSNKEHLAFYIHLMKSPHDAALHWPFSGKIYLFILHPTCPEATVKEVLISRPDLDTFKRPEWPISPRAFGYSEFITIQHIVQGGFLTNNTLTACINVQCV